MQMEPTSAYKEEQISVSVFSGPGAIKSSRSGPLVNSGTGSVGRTASVGGPSAGYMVGPPPSTGAERRFSTDAPRTSMQGRGWSAGPAPRSPARTPRSNHARNNQMMQLADGTIISDFDDDIDAEQANREYKPIFCTLAFLGCCLGFLIEMQVNGFKFQPFTCPATCEDGTPCNDDGTPCEANILAGPSIETMTKCGGKLDAKIYDEGEWWRVLTCNWLHGGCFHLLMNMLAVWTLGFPLERNFGWWKIGSLYILSGIFGTMVSVVFLPNVLSVGASASVFGLVGACWADVILNYCARCTLKDANFGSLLLSTIVNVAIGLTPLVDNFMHMGGFVAGIVVGLILFSRKHPNKDGVLKYTQCQRNIIFVAVVAFVVLFLITIGVALGQNSKEKLRSCTWCAYINCVEPTIFNDGKPWWDCDMASFTGFACTLQNTTSQMLCFCTEEASCGGISLANASDGSCVIGTNDGCSTTDATWCRDDICSRL